MKRRNKKLLTLALAGALCTATLGGVVGLLPAASADEVTEKTYALTSVFSKNATAQISAQKLNESDEAQTATFTLANGDSVRFNRDLAFKWYEAQDEAKAGEVRYMNLDFAFGDTNFKTLSFVIESAPAEATAGGKAVNTSHFVKDADGKIKAGVLNGKSNDTSAFAEVTVNAKTVTALTLSDKETGYGEFNVFFGEQKIGTMKNVGKNFADTSSVETLVIKAETEGSNETTLFLNNLNGQSFNNIKEENGVKMVKDDAAPVLVVNEEISGFLLGTAFSLDYEKIDVLKSSSLSETKKYHQYNPAKNPSYEDNTLTTSTYFMDTVYYYKTNEDGTVSYADKATEGYTATSVYRENEKEYVSIQITLGDEAFTGDNKVTYDLAWYVSDSVKADLFKQVWTEKTKDADGNEVETEKTTSYITLDRNTDGPKYNYITLNDEEKTNVVDEEALNRAIEIYQDELKTKAKDVYAGNNAEIQLPAIDWLINDNNGYQSLSFTVSYYKPDSTTAATASSLDYDELEFSTKAAGNYEFKILAKDKAGNPMKYYLNGELVEVSTSNVWDIEEIPSFTFTIADQGIKIEDNEDRDTIDSKILDQTYTLTKAKIVGAGSEASAHKLYVVDINAYNKTLTGDMSRLTTGILSGIKYNSIQTIVKTQIPTVTNGEYFAIYKAAYVQLIADALGVSEDTNAKTALNACIKEIAAFDDRITEEDEDAWNESDNKYRWNASEASFKAVEEGVYLILSDYWDTELAYVDRVAAYKLVEVNAAADVIKGETEWVKNNVVSVVLFSIAGVMLVLIIILLLIKPTDETLEDVEAKAKAKKEKKAKADKKND